MILFYVLGEIIPVTHSVWYLVYRKRYVTTRYQDCLLDLTTSLQYHLSPPQCHSRKIQVNVRDTIR